MFLKASYNPREMSGEHKSKQSRNEVSQQLATDLTALEVEEEEGLTVLPRAEKAARRPWTRRPPAAAGIGRAAATMGSVAASHARHSRGWRVGPPPVSMEGSGAEHRDAGISPVGAGACVCARIGREESESKGRQTGNGTRFWCVSIRLLPVAGRFSDPSGSQEAFI